MKRLVILGSGTGGTMVAAKIRKRLDESEWKIIIIDKDEKLYYPPGYVFIPFGIYTEDDCVKPACYIAVGALNINEKGYTHLDLSQ